MGEHGDSMVFVKSQSYIGERKIGEVLNAVDLAIAFKQTKHAASEIKKTQLATYYAVASCAVYIMEKILEDSTDVFPASTFIPEKIQKTLGCGEIFMSLPTKITQHGFSCDDSFFEIYEIQELKRSAAIIQQQQRQIRL